MSAFILNKKIIGRLAGDWVTGISLLIIFLAVVTIFQGLGFQQWETDKPRGVATDVDEMLVLENISNRQAVLKPGSPSGPVSEKNSVSEYEAESLHINKVALLGVSIELRELREGTDGDGRIRNFEFFIREGILPKRLFPDSSQVVTQYWPLYHNNVGYGASTVRILYQLIAEDTNGNGQLDHGDRKSLAVSLPDGSGFRVVDSEVGSVSGLTYLSGSGELHVVFADENSEEVRAYFLHTGQ